MFSFESVGSLGVEPTVQRPKIPLRITHLHPPVLKPSLHQNPLLFLGNLRLSASQLVAPPSPSSVAMADPTMRKPGVRVSYLSASSLPDSGGSARKWWPPMRRRECRSWGGSQAGLSCGQGASLRQRVTGMIGNWLGYRAYVHLSPCSSSCYLLRNLEISPLFQQTKIAPHGNAQDLHCDHF